MRCRRLLLAALVLALPAWAQAPLPSAALAALGRAVFFDAELSPSGEVSCASCHDPRHAFGPPEADALRRGFRAAPSLRYLNELPPFSMRGGRPVGGHDWDGRAASLREQARTPLLSPDEMGGPSVEAVAQRLRKAPYAPQFRRLFGTRIFDRPDAAFGAALTALEAFQRVPAEFHPFSSRFDAMLRGTGTLTAPEQRGLALFNDPARGNCASCHPSALRPGGALPLFTDFRHRAIGVPRNRAIAANADPRFVDLGLCGPLRTDLAARDEQCGRFRTPTLRNVALRQRFFHNAAITSLEAAVRFSAARASDPPSSPDDLPPRYHGNVAADAPRARTAPLDDREIADLVAFLHTLTDADRGENAATRDGARAPRR